MSRVAIPRPCPGCGNQMPRKQNYCSRGCRTQHKIELWLSGDVIPVSKRCRTIDFIRDYLMEQANYQCTKCKWGEVNPKTGNVPLHVDHIDGDCSNNQFENLQILCPNCHSLTENYGALNMGNSKRHSSSERSKIES